MNRRELLGAVGATLVAGCNKSITTETETPTTNPMETATLSIDDAVSMEVVHVDASYEMRFVAILIANESQQPVSYDITVDFIDSEMEFSTIDSDRRHGTLDGASQELLEFEGHGETIDDFFVYEEFEYGNA